MQSNAMDARSHAMKLFSVIPLHIQNQSLHLFTIQTLLLLLLLHLHLLQSLPLLHLILLLGS